MASNANDLVYNSSTVKVKTPEGNLFVDILENDVTGKPFKLLARIGKSGSTTNAWVDAVAALASHVLETHGLDYTIMLLHMIRSDKVVASSILGNRVLYVSSGPEGIAHALSAYKKDKYERLKAQLGIDEDDDHNYRSPSARKR